MYSKTYTVYIYIPQQSNLLAKDWNCASGIIRHTVLYLKQSNKTVYIYNSLAFSDSSFYPMFCSLSLSLSFLSVRINQRETRDREKEKKDRHIYKREREGGYYRRSNSLIRTTTDRLKPFFTRITKSTYTTKAHIVPQGWMYIYFFSSPVDQFLFFYVWWADLSYEWACWLCLYR